LMKARENNCRCAYYILCLEDVLKAAFFCILSLVAHEISAQSLPEN